MPPAIPAHAAPSVPAFLSPVSLAGWAGRIDWSRAEALRQGDAAALPSALVPLATRASRLDPIATLASLLGVTPLAVVIALLARTMANGDRNAGRVFRATLGRAEAARVEVAAWAVGL